MGAPLLPSRGLQCNNLQRTHYHRTPPAGLQSTSLISSRPFAAPSLRHVPAGKLVQQPAKRGALVVPQTSPIAGSAPVPLASEERAKGISYMTHPNFTPFTLPSGNPPVYGAYAGKTAIVVGAGPAGSTAAMYLAAQGFTVEVFEKRSEPAQDAVDTGRAYIIILIPRGQNALEELKVQLPTDESFKTQGTVRHTPDGKTTVSKEPGNITFSRSGLAQFLIDTAKARYPYQIRFHFNASLEHLDLAKRSATFSVADWGDTSTRQYDLLVGADGAGSKVRDTIQLTNPNFSTTIDDSGREYKVYGPLRGDIEPPEFRGKPGATLHLYTTKSPFTTLTAHSNPDGTYTGTFSLKTGGFSALRTVEDYERLLRDNFKAVPAEWIPQIARQVVYAPPNSAGKRIKCSQLNAPHVVLLGDAGHGCTPVFGQGANSALESCSVLDKVMTKAKGRVEDIPAAFNKARLPDVHALYEIDQKAYSFFRRKGPLDPDFLQLLSHIALGTILSKIVPFLYGSKPALQQLGSRMPYSQIINNVKRDSFIAAILVVALLAFAAFKLAGWA